MAHHSPVIQRFLRYVQIDTQSAEGAGQVPSTQKQLDLARLLVDELLAMGITDARLDGHGYVYGTIPATPGLEALPALGFLAHMDTSPAVSGQGVTPRIVEGYDGGDIPLGDRWVLSPAVYPELRDYLGQDLIVTDGSTLLGADDKAGVAEMMAMAQVLTDNPAIPHGTLKLAFTPDEEVGRGTDFFDVAGWGAAYAYTVDGGALGELEYENFNAASAQLTFLGVGAHPGGAKDRMRNALHLAMELHRMLPPAQTPEHTQGYEGFFHLDHLEGDVEEAKSHYIIRDHDRDRFEARKAQLTRIADYLNAKYGPGTVRLELADSYYNMKEQILPHMHLIDNAKQAMADLGIQPLVTPIRGGTDGARLSYAGLPCPNLCTGGHNYHSRFEYIPVQSMERVVSLLLRIVAIYGKGDRA